MSLSGLIKDILLKKRASRNMDNANREGPVVRELAPAVSSFVTTLQNMF